LPYVADIHTHIEPRAVPAAPADLEDAEVERLEAQICAVVEAVPGLHACHHLHIRPGPDGYDVVLDCLADPEILVGEAHRLADQAEKRLYAQVPGVAQVLIHVEPGPQ
jgi:divalent metal cation (Fe/Co/Zn/Cd) transporter